MQTFTQPQALRVLDFFATTIASTLEQCKNELADDGQISMTQVRLYDSACLAENYAVLANKYEDVNDETVFTFTVEDVEDALSALDTEFRDSVIEWFLEWDDEIAVLVFGKTYAQYIDEVSKINYF